MTSRTLSRAAWAAFWLALAFALFMALVPKPPQIVEINNDKIDHMLAFTTLAILGAIGFPRMSLLRLGERLSFVGAMIEVLQAIPVLHRDCDYRDWIADTASVAVVLLIVALIRRGAAPVPQPAPKQLPLPLHLALTGLAISVAAICAMGLLNDPPAPHLQPQVVSYPTT
jgi:hypothetical protein